MIEHFIKSGTTTKHGLQIPVAAPIHLVQRRLIRLVFIIFLRIIHEHPGASIRILDHKLILGCKPLGNNGIFILKTIQRFVHQHNIADPFDFILFAVDPLCSCNSMQVNLQLVYGLFWLLQVGRIESVNSQLCSNMNVFISRRRFGDRILVIGDTQDLKLGLFREQIPEALVSKTGAAKDNRRDRTCLIWLASRIIEWLANNIHGI